MLWRSRALNVANVAQQHPCTAHFPRSLLFLAVAAAAEKQNKRKRKQQKCEIAKLANSIKCLQFAVVEATTVTTIVLS
jgi:hypothetical protein